MTIVDNKTKGEVFLPVARTDWQSLEIWLQLMPKAKFLKLEELMEKVRSDRTVETKTAK